MCKSGFGSGRIACVFFVSVPCIRVNRAIIHVEDSIHSVGLALPAGDDGQAFEGASEGWKVGEGGIDGCKRRTGTEESIIPFIIIPFAHVGLK